MNLIYKLFSLNIIAYLVALWWIINKYCKIDYYGPSPVNIEYRYCLAAAEITSTLLFILTLILFIWSSKKNNKHSRIIAISSLNLLIFLDTLFALCSFYLSDLSSDYAIIAFWRNNAIDFLQIGIFIIIVVLFKLSFISQKELKNEK